MHRQPEKPRYSSQQANRWSNYNENYGDSFGQSNHHGVGSSSYEEPMWSRREPSSSYNNATWQHSNDYRNYPRGGKAPFRNSNWDNQRDNALPHFGTSRGVFTSEQSRGHVYSSRGNFRGAYHPRGQSTNYGPKSSYASNYFDQKWYNASSYGKAYESPYSNQNVPPEEDEETYWVNRYKHLNDVEPSANFKRNTFKHNGASPRPRGGYNTSSYTHPRNYSSPSFKQRRESVKKDKTPDPKKTQKSENVIPDPKSVKRMSGSSKNDRLFEKSIPDIDTDPKSDKNIPELQAVECSDRVVSGSGEISDVQSIPSEVKESPSQSEVKSATVGGGFWPSPRKYIENLKTIPVYECSVDKENVDKSVDGWEEVKPKHSKQKDNVKNLAQGDAQVEEDNKYSILNDENSGNEEEQNETLDDDISDNECDGDILKQENVDTLGEEDFLKTRVSLMSEENRVHANELVKKEIERILSDNTSTQNNEKLKLLEKKLKELASLRYIHERAPPKKLNLLNINGKCEVPKGKTVVFGGPRKYNKLRLMQITFLKQIINRLVENDEEKLHFKLTYAYLENNTAYSLILTNELSKYLKDKFVHFESNPNENGAEKIKKVLCETLERYLSEPNVFPQVRAKDKYKVLTGTVNVLFHYNPKAVKPIRYIPYKVDRGKSSADFEVDFKDKLMVLFLFRLGYCVKVQVLRTQEKSVRLAFMIEQKIIPNLLLEKIGIVVELKSEFFDYACPHSKLDFAKENLIFSQMERLDENVVVDLLSPNDTNKTKQALASALQMYATNTKFELMKYNPQILLPEERKLEIFNDHIKLFAEESFQLLKTHLPDEELTPDIKDVPTIDLKVDTTNEECPPASEGNSTIKTCHESSPSVKKVQKQQVIGSEYCLVLDETLADDTPIKSKPTTSGETEAEPQSNVKPVRRSMRVAKSTPTKNEGSKESKNKKFTERIEEIKAQEISKPLRRSMRLSKKFEPMETDDKDKTDEVEEARDMEDDNVENHDELDDLGEQISNLQISAKQSSSTRSRYLQQKQERIESVVDKWLNQNIPKLVSIKAKNELRYNFTRKLTLLQKTPGENEDLVKKIKDKLEEIETLIAYDNITPPESYDSFCIDAKGNIPEGKVLTQGKPHELSLEHLLMIELFQAYIRQMNNEDNLYFSLRSRCFENNPNYVQLMVHEISVYIREIINTKIGDSGDDVEADEIVNAVVTAHEKSRSKEKAKERADKVKVEQQRIQNKLKTIAKAVVNRTKKQKQFNELSIDRRTSLLNELIDSVTSFDSPLEKPADVDYVPFVADKVKSKDELIIDFTDLFLAYVLFEFGHFPKLMVLASDEKTKRQTFLANEQIVEKLVLQKLNKCVKLSEELPEYTRRAADSESWRNKFQRKIMITVMKQSNENVSVEDMEVFKQIMDENNDHNQQDAVETLVPLLNNTFTCVKYKLLKCSPHIILPEECKAELFNDLAARVTKNCFELLKVCTEERTDSSWQSVRKSVQNCFNQHDK